jgi:hypothetical protein
MFLLLMIPKQRQDVGIIVTSEQTSELILLDVEGSSVGATWMNTAAFSHGSRMQLWFSCEGKKPVGRSCMTAPSAGALAACCSAFPETELWNNMAAGCVERLAVCKDQRGSSD